MVMAQRKEHYTESLAYPYEDTQDLALATKRRATPIKEVSRLQKARLQSLVMVLMAITVFGIIGALTVHTNVVKGAEIRALHNEIQALTIEGDLLQVEVDQLRSVARIEKVALAMGMEKPEGTLYIASSLVQPTKTTGVKETQQTAALEGKGKADSIMENVLRIFTSFFASTQR